MSDHVEAMLQTHPVAIGGIDRDMLVACLRACLDCAQTCTSCAYACLAEDMVAELRQCIRRNQDCADVCAATARVLTRRSGTNDALVRSLLAACQEACRSCAEECEQHAGMHEHCRICAEACRHCEQACAELLAELG